ncbi:cellulose biosynthesis protein BcsQ [Geothermobacter ehrlichii]|uniref:Cellulose biosynthesis protein BcsQ n=1 Tax=Geothermobacter ehrlichii TaxID=213224 RepID=A0A5D3WPY1_9BACT|nr:ParA family protein [Geothermobacter ehrlichii]TYO99859.1 cellulose biosynthesis protein BcsQ [Geothermobacter ehrlichii]
MTDSPLYVVAVASEKGGVGKTTIATNLAVYLKALAEELPVTIASFDNHFSVDNMFAIGGGSAATVAGLFQDRPAAGLVRLGEYGVQFIGSERRLEPPADPTPDLLRRRLAASGLSGVLILDTRPILDFFTRAALGAADLVLVPVKDRASVVNAASILAAAEGEEQGQERVWLVPSLIDGRLRLGNGVGMREYLAFIGQERGFRLAPAAISKSPKVESLASGFDSRIHPVLTRARGTAVHRQMRELASFVLERRRQAMTEGGLRCAAVLQADVPPGRRRRLLRKCPVCDRPADGSSGRLFQDRRSRRRGVVHAPCFGRLLARTDIGSMIDGFSGILALVLSGSGLTGAEPQAWLCLYDGECRLELEERVSERGLQEMLPFFERVCDQPVESLLREVILFPLLDESPGQLLTASGVGGWRQLALRVLREVAARNL